MWDFPMDCCPGTEWTLRVLGSDGCGNVILCLKRPRQCCVNGCNVPCRRYR